MTTAVRTPHAHGTYARAKGNHRNGTPRCYCPKCRATERAYDKRRRYLKSTGRPLRVPAEPVAAHLDALFAAGAGWTQLAQLAGVSLSTLSKLRNRDWEKISPTLAEKILATTPGQGITDRRSVPAVGAIRRVRALMAIGHTVTAISEAAGLNHTVMHQVVNAQVDTLWYSTHRQIAAAYRAMVKQPGSNTRARLRAERLGWPGPMAWDDNIDDPAAEPEIEDLTASNAPSRDHLSIRELAAERREWIKRLTDSGHESAEIATRLGMSVTSVRAIVNELRTGKRRDRRKQVAA